MSPNRLKSHNRNWIFFPVYSLNANASKGTKNTKNKKAPKLFLPEALWIVTTVPGCINANVIFSKMVRALVIKLSQRFFYVSYFESQPYVYLQRKKWDNNNRNHWNVLQCRRWYQGGKKCTKQSINFYAIHIQCPLPMYIFILCNVFLSVCVCVCCCCSLLYVIVAKLNNTEVSW